MGLLSDTQVRAAAPRDTEYFLRDGDGLYLRIRPTGKTWAYRYQLAGKAAKLGLGAYPAVSLARARQKAREMAETRAEGVLTLKRLAAWRPSRNGIEDSRR